MKLAQSVVSIYQDLQVIVGPRRARETLACLFRNYVAELQENQQDLDEKKLEDYFAEQANLYADTSKKPLT